jgi:hypothetical protein
VLFDEEKQSRMTRDELVRAKLIKDDNIVFVTDAFDSAQKPAEADIEDLFEPAIFDALVKDSYAKELKSKTLTLNPQIPRIVKRYEKAFEALGIEFHKTRPARLLLNKMSTEAPMMIPQSSVERFERLFKFIAEQFAKTSKRNAKPFE